MTGKLALSPIAQRKLAEMYWSNLEIQGKYAALEPTKAYLSKLI